MSCVLFRFGSALLKSLAKMTLVDALVAANNTECSSSGDVFAFLCESKRWN